MIASAPIYWRLPGTTVGRLAVDALWEFYATLEQLQDAPNVLMGAAYDPFRTEAGLKIARIRLANVLVLPGLESCRRAGKSLDGCLEQALKTAMSGGPQKRMEAALEFELGSAAAQAEAFSHVLYDGLKRLVAYVPEMGGNIKDDRLAGSAEDCLSDLSRKTIPASAISDINAAGRAIAFDLSTACGFHVGRALETCVEDFALATQETRAAIEGPGNGNLGALCNAMAHGFGLSFPWSQQRLIGKQERAGAVIANLFMLKDLYRNALAHERDFTMTQDDAARFFYLAIACIDDLSNERVERQWSTAAQ